MKDYFIYVIYLFIIKFFSECFLGVRFCVGINSLRI